MLNYYYPLSILLLLSMLLQGTCTNKQANTTKKAQKKESFSVAEVLNAVFDTNTKQANTPPQQHSVLQHLKESKSAKELLKDYRINILPLYESIVAETVNDLLGKTPYRKYKTRGKLKNIRDRILEQTAQFRKILLGDSLSASDYRKGATLATTIIGEVDYIVSLIKEEEKTIIKASTEKIKGIQKGLEALAAGKEQDAKAYFLGNT